MALGAADIARHVLDKMPTPVIRCLLKSQDSKANMSEEERSEASRHILRVIDSLKKKVTADRFTYIKNRIEDNKIKLSPVTQSTGNSSKIWQRSTSNSTDSNLLTSRQDDVLSSGPRIVVSLADEDGVSSDEESSYATSTVMLGGNLAAKNVTRPIKLPEAPKIPPYTTWTFLDSDSEDEAVEDEEEKKEFKVSEDCLIRMTIQECGMSDAVLETLARFFDRAAGDIKASFLFIIIHIISITFWPFGLFLFQFTFSLLTINTYSPILQSRYEILNGEKTEGSLKKVSELNAKVEDLYRDKDLDAALDSFDNLFCRRCLVFDCKLHGCSQDLVFPTEKQPPWNSMDDGVPCGIHCYKLAPKPEATTTVDSDMLDIEEPTHSSDNTRNQLSSNKKKQGSSGKKAKSQQSEGSSTQRVASESSDSEGHPMSTKSPQQSSCQSKVKISPKGGIRKSTNRRIAERILMSVKKGQREVAPSDSNSGGCLWPRDMKLRSDTRNGHKDSVASQQQNSPSTRSSRKKDAPQMENSLASGEDRNDSTVETKNEHSATDGHDSSMIEDVEENICRQENNCRSWKVIEQGLLVKGLEIFGRNSCLIARNLLCGMKTCSDVFHYMSYIENSSASGTLSRGDSLVKGYIKFLFSCCQC
ncbi:unnamed protein product [Triticum turgidum subsp. durum]|uniref:Histone-lysine N-methyltransferase CLF-like HTH domain-containing protein n=1 Tax=Triticum turgidum subsp. durum TaxID=4567 RepID=A0A9R0Z6E1_TRITD|nr:unnamed protein product [Triticum turgidum subsp. durum]